MKNHSISMRKTTEALLVAVIVLVSARAAFSFGPTFDPLPMTREADLILRGRVIELRENSIIVRVVQTLKGSVSGSDLEVVWDRRRTVERVPKIYKAGENFLVFLKVKNGRYEPLRGPEGTLNLDSKDASQYPELVGRLLEFNSTAESDVRHAIIADFLARKDRVSRVIGLRLIAEEHEKRRLLPKKLAPAVERLAKDPDAQVAGNAVQALNHVGDKASMSLLLDLMGSNDPNISESAYSVFKHRTGSKIIVGTNQTATKRRQAIQETRQWWEKSKDNIEFR